MMMSFTKLQKRSNDDRLYHIVEWVGRGFGARLDTSSESRTEHVFYSFFMALMLCFRVGYC